MTPQEAKKELMHINLILAHQMDLARAEKEKDMLNRNYQANNIAISALEKQIPKKPLKSAEQVIRYVTTYDCPNCEKQFTGTKGANYCYHCGQHFDWSD